MCLKTLRVRLVSDFDLMQSSEVVLGECVVATRIRALIFDFDGTIVDTETPDYEAWRSIYLDHGCDLNLAAWVSRIGTVSGFDPFRQLQIETGRSLDHKSIETERRKRKLKMLDQQKLRSGVMEWLSGGREIGLSCGIASSAPRKWILPLLERLKIAEIFETVATLDDVTNAKPDPAVFQLAASHLGIDPEQAVAIEDSHHGVQASVAAQMFTVAVPNYMTREHDFSSAHCVLDSLSDSTLHNIMEMRGAEG